MGLRWGQAQFGVRKKGLRDRGLDRGIGGLITERGKL